MKKILTVLTFVVAVNLVFAQTKTEVTKIIVKKPRVKKLAKTITLTGAVDPGPI